MGPVGLVSALLAGLALSINAQDVCSNHGELVDGKCVCKSPLPVDTQPGWVGDQCSLPVHRVVMDGQDVQETCGEGHVCNVVTPTEPVCYSSSIAEMADTSYHMAILLLSINVDAAVTLRGLLTNFTADGTAVVPKAYPNTSAVYSFSLHTSHDATSAQLRLSRRQLGYGAYTGLYLCAESTATTFISLKAATHSCPFTLTPDGLELCSNRGLDNNTCPHGVCSCPWPYTPPANWVMMPGLGFEDCSATLLELMLTTPLTPQPQAALAPGGWAFFSVDWPAGGGHELHIVAAATLATQGELVLYLRHGQLPGAGEGQHDLTSDATRGSSGWRRDLSVHLNLMRTHAAFRQGTWYLGVHNRGSGPVTHTLAATLYDCPNNCSGRGTCAADTGTCTCSQSSMSTPDCASSSYNLTLGQPLISEQREFPYDTFVLYGVKEQLQAAGAAHLTLTASFTTSDPDPGLPAWVTGRPIVLVSPRPDAIANATAGDSGGPTAGPLSRMALPAPGTPSSMDVGLWMVGDDGALHVALWNPLSGPQRRVGYNLTVSAVLSCTADCSGRGTCDSATGKCSCAAPYLGNDCSVDPAQLACAPGTTHPVRRDDLFATCWTPCKPDGSGYDDTTCAELVCDGPGQGHGALRRKGKAVTCVEDACVAGNHTVPDASGDFVCSRRCSCPEDGAGCQLEPDCLPGSVQCLRGLFLEPGTSRCVAAPCQEGSLRRSYSVDGGSTFALCACRHAGDPTTCAFTTPSQSGSNAGGVVTCLPGYERQGSTGTTKLSDGSSVVTGGKCGRPRRHGVSGGMVFFYCLLSIALAAGLVVGGKYGLLWYEQYRYGRSVFSQGYVSWPLFGNRGNAAGGTDDW